MGAWGLGGHGAGAQEGCLLPSGGLDPPGWGPVGPAWPCADAGWEAQLFPLLPASPRGSAWAFLRETGHEQLSQGSRTSGPGQTPEMGATGRPQIRLEGTELRQTKLLFIPRSPAWPRAALRRG